MMNTGSSTRDDVVWSVAWWAIALVASIIAFFVVTMLMPGDPAAGLIFAGVAFVLVGALLVRFGPGPGPSEEVWHDPDALPTTPTAVAGHAHGHGHGHGHAAPAAPVAPAPAPATASVAEPVAPASPAAPVAAPLAGGAAVETPPPGTGISERVRDAARAAGEAARAMASDGIGRKPPALAAPREGAGDDLKRLKGIGPKLEVVLHDLGIYHFDQIAAWGPDEVAWVDANLDGFSGRVVREDWVGQARILAAGGETEHSQKVDRGDTA